MKVIYAQEEIPNKISKSVFLAGPSPRSKSVKSWRKDALMALDKMGYDGHVFVPEFEEYVYSDGSSVISDLQRLDDNSYKSQIEWEEKCLNIADIILFWIPRDMEKLPGLTTNDEFGFWKRSGKIVLGIPKNADKIDYQKYYAIKYTIPIFDSLNKSIVYIVDKLGDGAERNGGETYVPLHVWNHVGFQNWYKELKSAGNRLDDARVEYTKWVGKDNNYLFFISLWAKVWISSEYRHKENEVAIMRSDISSAVLYRLDKYNIMDSDIILVKEFRTPVSNYSGMVWEVPGGSSFKDNVSAEDIIISELQEEVGITFEKSRIIYNENRQLQSTTLTHKSHLYSVELTQEELDEIRENTKNKTFGETNDTEITYVEIVKLDSILKTELVDWANVGQILSILIRK